VVLFCHLKRDAAQIECADERISIRVTSVDVNCHAQREIPAVKHRRGGGRMDNVSV